MTIVPDDIREKFLKHHEEKKEMKGNLRDKLRTELRHLMPHYGFAVTSVHPHRRINMVTIEPLSSQFKERIEGIPLADHDLEGMIENVGRFRVGDILVHSRHDSFDILLREWRKDRYTNLGCLIKNGDIITVPSDGYEGVLPSQVSLTDGFAVAYTYKGMEFVGSVVIKDVDPMQMNDRPGEEQCKVQSVLNKPGRPYLIFTDPVKPSGGYQTTPIHIGSYGYAWKDGKLTNAEDSFHVREISKRDIAVKYPQLNKVPLILLTDHKSYSENETQFSSGAIIMTDSGVRKVKGNMDKDEFKGFLNAHIDYINSRKTPFPIVAIQNGIHRFDPNPFMLRELGFNPTLIYSPKH